MNDDPALMLVGLRAGVVIAMMRELDTEDVRRWAHAARNHLERTDTLGPIIDPTNYIRDSERARHLVRISSTFAELRVAIEEAQQGPVPEGLADLFGSRSPLGTIVDARRDR